MRVSTRRTPMGAPAPMRKRSTRIPPRPEVIMPAAGLPIPLLVIAYALMGCGAKEPANDMMDPSTDHPLCAFYTEGLATADATGNRIAFNEGGREAGLDAVPGVDPAERKYDYGSY